MKNFIYILLSAFLINQGFSQTKKKDSLFSDIIKSELSIYSQQAKNAYLKKDFDAGKALFRSFVDTKIANSYLDNFRAKNMNGAIVSINDYFKKPVILMTYASWCVVEEGEIPALNDLAKKHHDKIDFVVLFWDKKSNAKKQAKKFNNKVNVLYIDETENMFSSEVKNLKHALGFPLAYYIDSQDRVIDVKKKTPEIMKNKKEYLNSYVQNYNEFVDGLNSLLINGEIINEHLVGK